MSKITIPTGNVPPNEYARQLHTSLSVLLKLGFSQPKAELTEDQTEAVYHTVDFMERLFLTVSQ